MVRGGHEQSSSGITFEQRDELVHCNEEGIQHILRIVAIFSGRIAVWASRALLDGGWAMRGDSIGLCRCQVGCRTRPAVSQNMRGDEPIDPAA